MALRGFGNTFSSEALPDSLPSLGNQPQKCPRGLYAELLSGTAFTVPRQQNRQTWLYRIRPGVDHGAFEAATTAAPGVHAGSFDRLALSPRALRWRPRARPPVGDSGVTFLQGLQTLGGSGNPTLRQGCALYSYSLDCSMGHDAFANADGDMLFVPQMGELEVRTELGCLHVAPHEIAMVPHGVRFQVGPRANAEDTFCRGFVLENYRGHWELPDVGVLGYHGLASPQDFESPSASFEDTDEHWGLFHKLGGELFRAEMDHSPFDVVAWKGNYTPWKYDMLRFNCVGSLNYDHLDASRFCVVCVPGDEPGSNLWEFGALPPRWEVAENTFRPPPFHRNGATEFYWEIDGSDALAEDEDRLVAGGLAVVPSMTAHGPHRGFWEFAAEKMETSAPLKLTTNMVGGVGCLAETRCTFRYTDWALGSSGGVLSGRYKDWQGFPNNFRHQLKDTEVA